MTSTVFKELEAVENIKKVVKNLFDVELNISGGWGYGADDALIINSLDMPMGQFTNLFATLRTNVEMSFNLDKDEKYGGIALNEEDRKETHSNGRGYSIVSFKVTAMKEKQYAEFIKEYKENYGKKEFDLAGHFRRRKEQTLKRVVECWFCVEQ